MANRPPNKFAQFVKLHYNEVKAGTPWSSHKEVMQKISGLYASQKKELDY